jgi:hypothetical protein
VGAVDFSEWVAPDLVLTLGGRTYKVPPPSVEQAKKIIAAAVRGEVNLRIVKGEIPAEIQAVLDTFDPIERPGLGPVAEQLVADGIPVETIDRMDYYAVFYWARGKEYADSLALVLWAPRAGAEAGAPAPKVRTRSRRKSGRSTASASR